MRIVPFLTVARNEGTSRRFLLEACRLAHPFACPSCGAEKLYEIERGARRRCARCGYSFAPFKGRWLGAVNIPARAWLWIAKLFELDMPASTISEETAISYPTVLKALETIRMAMVGGRGPGFGEAPPRDEAVVGSTRTSIKGGLVSELLDPRMIRRSIPLSRGRMICADRSVPFTSLACAGEELPLVDRGNRFPRWRIYCSADPGFWPYAKERLAKHHGVSERKLALYILELEFRYINRARQLFDVIVERLAAPIQSRAPGAPTESPAPAVTADAGLAGPITR